MRLTRLADGDIGAAFRTTRDLFGPAQVRIYATLLARAASLVAEDPQRAGSRSRPELGAGVRSFHAEHAAGRRGAASHDLVYLVRGPEPEEEIVVLRVLHDAMQPARRFAAALRDEVTRSSRPRPPR